MISREELIKYASQEGFPITTWQVTRWHKHGVLPRPVRESNQGKAGSTYSYPDYAKANLNLIITSPYRRDLDALLLDVWLRGGTVNVDKLRAILIKPVKVIGAAVRKLDKILSAMEHQVLNPKNFKYRQGLFPFVNPNDILTTVNVGLNTLSPNDHDRIWEPSGLEDLTGEQTAGEIADRVLGISLLRTLDPDRQSETSETTWNEMKELLNLKQLKGAVTNATKEELEAVRPIVILAEKVIEGLAEINRQAKQPIPLFNFWNNRMFSPVVKRILLVVGCLTLYINEKSKDWVISAVKSWSPLLPRLEAWSMYSRHMRQHPTLARRRTWQRYIDTCDADTLESLRAHHHLFFQMHPEWKAVLLPEDVIS